MIILKLKAGLGNQMFQYAYARALSLRSGVPLRIDLSWFDNQPERDTKRFYGLNHFNIKADIATPEEVRPYSSPAAALARKAIQKIKRAFFRKSDFVFYPAEAMPRKHGYVEGYWNSDLYFKDAEEQIRSELTLKEPLCLTATGVQKEIELALQNEQIPVLVHVRRGDYVTNIHAQAFHGSKGSDYYKAAMEELDTMLGDKENRVKYFIASDDIAWVKEHVRFNHPAYYISHLDIRDYEEIYLMSLCSHFIISNSTFSWWSAWLSPAAGKIVVGPKQWVADPRIDTRDVMPANWVRI